MNITHILHRSLLCGVLLLSVGITTSACSGEEGDKQDTPQSFVNVSSDSFTFGAASSLQAEVKVSTSGEWQAYSNDEWLSVDPPSSTQKDATVTITARHNDSKAQRVGTVYISTTGSRAAISITQAAPLQVSDDKLYVRSTGDEFTVVVTASDANWTATASAPWIKVQYTSDATTLLVTADANDSLEDREGTITVKSGPEEATIAVLQGGADDRNIADPPVAGYHLVWHDEFATDGSLDTNNWRHEVKSAGWVNHELQNYVNEKSPSGRRVTEIIDGKLHINCFKEDGKVYSGRVYGNVTTGWQYGYVEARIKLPSGKGTWPAFWMMPVNFKSWPHDGEIDIMEEVGYHKDYVSSSLHADGHVHSNGTQVTKEVYCKGAEGEFHVYGMEWTKDYFQFYVDGKKTLYYKNPGTGVRDWPYDAPFYVILNLAWGGDWGGSQGVDESKLPLTMEVDYVRIFQK